MKLAVYNEILHLMHTYKSRDSLPLIAEKFPGVTINALGSIFSQDYQKKMRKTHYLHYSPEAANNYFERFAAGLKDGEKKILINLSEQLDLSPALLGRIILERHLATTKYEGETPPKAVVTQYMREPSLIEEPAIAIEIQQCILVDDHYGPICDSIKHSIGHEYEFKLYRELNKLGLSYIDYPVDASIVYQVAELDRPKVTSWIQRHFALSLCEEQMRAKGYDKTPDVKLEVPIGQYTFLEKHENLISHQMPLSRATILDTPEHVDGAVDGHVVNWIESKASFGDEHSHKTYLKDQFWSYWNRFGPGMVIYWFGFIDELDVNQEKGIILHDCFPENIVKMDPTIR